MTHSEPSALRLALGGSIGMAVAMGIGRFVYTPILPGMMAGVPLSAAEAGWIASANYAGYLAGALALAGGGGAGRERGLYLSALVASSLLCLAMAFAPGVWSFAAIRFAAGLASAFVMVFLSASVFAGLAVAGKPELQWLHFAGVGTGIAVSALLTGAVHMADGAWPDNWIAAALLSLAGAGAVALVIPRRGGLHAGAAREPRLVWTGPLIRIALAYGLFGAGYIVSATFIVAIVRQNAAGPLFESAVWLVTGLCAAPSVWLWNFVRRHIGYGKTFAVACIAEAAGAAISVATGGAAGPMIGGALLGGTFVAITSYGLQAGRLLAGPAPRRALALLTAAFGAGQIIGPVVAGYVAEATGNFMLASLGAAAILGVAGAIAASVKAQ